MMHCAFTTTRNNLCFDFELKCELILSGGLMDCYQMLSHQLEISPIIHEKKMVTILSKFNQRFTTDDSSIDKVYVGILSSKNSPIEFVDTMNSLNKRGDVFSI